jgi:hypothetical protein
MRNRHVTSFCFSANIAVNYRQKKEHRTIPTCRQDINVPPLPHRIGLQYECRKFPLINRDAFRRSVQGAVKVWRVVYQWQINATDNTTRQRVCWQRHPQHDLRWHSCVQGEGWANGLKSLFIQSVLENTTTVTLGHTF